METCTVCGSRLEGRWGNRCYKCKPGRARSGEDRQCAHCGGTFYAPAWVIKDKARNSGTYCSVKCRAAALTGREFRTGTTYVTSAGYRMVKVGVRKLRLEHRLVVEASIGRPLGRREEVHHINGDKLDNRLENLIVVSPSEHQAYHSDFIDRLRQKRTVPPVPTVCELCGFMFERPGKRPDQRFCSRKCSTKATGGRKPKV